jgi:hypothetical protein
MSMIMPMQSQLTKKGKYERRRFCLKVSEKRFFSLKAPLFKKLYP